MNINVHESNKRQRFLLSFFGSSGDVTFLSYIFYGIRGLPSRDMVQDIPCNFKLQVSVGYGSQNQYDIRPLMYEMNVRNGISLFHHDEVKQIKSGCIQTFLSSNALTRHVDRRKFLFTLSEARPSVLRKAL